MYFSHYIFKIYRNPIKVEFIYMCYANLLIECMCKSID